jgi:DNA transposition AAA+ family ATPase
MQENDPIPERPNGTRRWSIPTTTVNEATASMPEEHRAALRWLQGYGIDSNKTIDEVAALLKKRDGSKYSRDSVYQALTGRREAGTGLNSIVGSILELRRSVEARNSVGFPYVTWKVSERIWELCEMAFTYQDIVFIYGRSHRGKTVPLKQYAKEKPFGRVIYIEMPIGGYISAFKADLAEALKISGKYSTNELSKRIREAIDPGMILIVDQFHRAVPRNRRQSLDTFDFIMQLHDLCECGVVLCGTPQAREEIENEKGNNAEFFRQLINRSVGSFVIEDAVSANDLVPFAKAIDLPPATGEALDLQTATISSHSLGKWIKLLRTAMRLAANKNQPLAWEHVIKANRWLTAQGESK